MKRALAALVAVAVAGCGGGDGTSAESAPDVRTEPPAGGRTTPAPGADARAPVRRAVRRYFAALNAEDAGRICSLLVRGAIPDCEPELERTLGKGRRGGFPPWTGVRVEQVRSVSVSGGRARVTVGVVHSFEDRDPLPVEDDVIHLAKRDGRWLIAKPSASLHRAVGDTEITPDVLAAP